MKWILLLLMVVSCSRTAVISDAESRDQQITRYLGRLESMSSVMCPKGTEDAFQTQFRAYRGSGYFIPVIDEKKLDVVVVRDGIPAWQRKLKWIDDQRRELKSKKELPPIQSTLLALRLSLDGLLTIKENFSKEKSENARLRLEKETQTEWARLRTQFHDLIRFIPFMTFDGFPVDFLDLRASYDAEKGRESPEAQSKRNRLYFERKRVEDGALDSDHTRPDASLRALLSMISLQLDERAPVLPENLRFDIDTALSWLEKIWARGWKTQVERLDEWHMRTTETIAFYQSLLKDGNTIDKLLNERSLARSELRDFVFKREAEVYRFWMKEPERMKALYVLETILMNEVGNMDSIDGLERRDVAQVVLNRLAAHTYRQLGVKDELRRYLSDVDAATLEKETWLNVLFKEGEFSFTYYFIPGALRVFCPESTPTAKRLRLENLAIALDQIKRPNHSFKALRYFSRVSMNGHIDMGKLWSGFRPIKERPGAALGRRPAFSVLMDKKAYRYFYSFTDPTLTWFDVVEISNQTHVVHSSSEGRVFYKYRNPQHFRYFESF